MYKGNTNFGFFSDKALANQVGLREASLYEASPAERGAPFAYPRHAPFPDDKLRMVDRVEAMRATIGVDPSAWFFDAHFYQDPVWPGSLGLEGFLQLMHYLAIERWAPGADAAVESIALGEEHRWMYRGQVVPANERVTIEAIVTGVDDNQRLLRAEGHLMVDGRIIYRMQNFAVRLTGQGPGAERADR